MWVTVSVAALLASSVSMLATRLVAFHPASVTDSDTDSGCTRVHRRLTQTGASREGTAAVAAAAAVPAAEAWVTVSVAALLASFCMDAGDELGCAPPTQPP